MVAVLLSCSIQFASCPARAEILGGTGASYVASAASSILFGKIISDLKKSIESVIKTADMSVDKNTFLAMQRLLVLVQSIESNYSGMLNKTSDQFTRQERDIYNYFQSAVSDVERLKNGTTSDAERILSHLDVIASAILPYANSTCVISYNPQRVVSEPSQPLLIKLTGRNFIAGSEVRYRDASGTTRAFTVNPSTSSLLQFSLPAGWTSSSNQKTILEISVKVLNNHQSWHQSWLNQRDTISYQIPIEVIPARLGSYSISYSFSKTTDVVQSKSDRPPQLFADNCRGLFSDCDRERHDNHYSCTPGWMIDVSSIELRRLLMQGESPVCRLENATASGFTVHCESEGERLWGRPGRVEYQVNYREYKGAVIPGQHSAFSVGELFWNRDVPIPLPPNTSIVKVDGFLASIKAFDGKEFQTTGGSQPEYLNVSFDPVTNIIILKPRKVNEIQF